MNNYGFDIGSALHNKVLTAFKDRLKLAQSGHSKRTDKWKTNEDMLKAYVPETDNDRLRSTARKVDGTPQYTTIEVPYSYALMLTLHTYLTSTFLSRTPILQMSGRHGESQQAEQAVEALLDYQIMSGNNLPVLYIWLLDPLRYGHGVIGQYWDEEQIAVSSRVPVARKFLGADIPGTEKMETLQQVVRGYVGTRLYNIRPQDFFHDPRLPFWRMQEGEFCIRYDQIGWSAAKQRERNGIYFNMELAAKSLKEPSFRDTGSSRTNLANGASIDQTILKDSAGNPTRLNIHEFYWEIIPKDFELGNGDRAEKWVFTIANESVVIGCQPLGLLHNKWPFDGLEYEIGGYELFNRSVLEVSKTLNDTLTWLFNSHFFNVRKTLNDQFFVDPTMISMEDMEDPNPGRLVRLKPAAYGKPVDQFVKQFQTVDVTRQHVQDSGFVADLMQKLLGANENLMGNTQGSRHTATEVRSATANAVNRIKTVCEWMSATGFAPMATKMLQVSQQMYDEERKFRIVGDLTQWGEKFITVTPDQIAGFYDFVHVDGTMPIDRYAQANLWQQLLGGVAQLPQIMGAYDMPKIFAFVAQLAGLKNINQFRIQVLPDNTMQNSIAAGNSVPLEAVQMGNQNEPGQIPGMGATG